MIPNMTQYEEEIRNDGVKKNNHIEFVKKFKKRLRFGSST